MNFELFKNIVKDNVSRKMGNEYKVTLNTVRKNNGIVLTGLTIMKEGSNISPTIYLDEYYELYKVGRYTIYTAVNDILKIYKENEIKNPIDVKFFLDFETVRPRIVHKLINTERNQELLKDIPHVNFLDLSIIFQVMMPENDNITGLATITIQNEHCKVWEIGIDELIFAARQNTPRLLPNTARSMQSVLTELLERNTLTENDIDILVLSNEKNINGGSVMLDKNFLRDCSDNMNGSYYIIPSSIHELLALPDTGAMHADELKEMVKEVNDTALEPGDILSYSVYYFDREKDELSVL